ncbi:MAG: Hsp70 family protein, partial [Methanosarcinaceae archaeon]|nr:Hsp70 family protein [Methanosarcinaceae archaeon]
DSNGILHVKAKDIGTGKEQSISIQKPGGLSDEEIDRMVKDAEVHAEEDARRKEEVEVKNNAESLVNAAEKTMKDSGDIATPQQKSSIEAAISDLKEALKGADIEAIKTKTEALQNAVYEVSTAMYQKAQEEATAAASAAGSEETTDQTGEPSEETVVDADYEVVDEDK